MNWQGITCPHCDTLADYDIEDITYEAQEFSCDYCKEPIYVTIAVTKEKPQHEFKAKWRKFNHGEWKELDKKYDHAAWEACFKHCTAPTLNEWFEQAEEATKKAMAECGGSPPFAPNAFYNAEGDILEVYLSDEQYYAKWLNPQLTVLLDNETNEVVGFQIWGLNHCENIKELFEKRNFQLKPKKDKKVESKK